MAAENENVKCDSEEFLELENEIVKLNKPKKGKEFRLSAKRYLLTYKTHINKEKFSKFINKKYKKGKSEKKPKIFICHETSDTLNPYEHSHVVLCFPTAIDWKGERCLDIKGNEEEMLHPNIRILKTETHYKNALKYICKQDGDIELLESVNLELSELGFNLVEAVWAEENVQGALMKYVKKASDVGGIIQLYNQKEDEKISYKPPEKFMPWQEKFIKIAEGVIDGRYSSKDHILNAFCLEGDSGKSEMCRTMKFLYPKHVCLITNIPTMKDIATIIESELKRGWSGKMIIMNVTRTVSDRKYHETIEALKDGFLTVTKYQGKTTFMNPPHITVFSNFMLSEMQKNERGKWVRALSGGRIKWWNIASGVDRSLVPSRFNTCPWDELFVDDPDYHRHYPKELDPNWYSIEDSEDEGKFMDIDLNKNKKHKIQPIKKNRD